MQWIKASDVKNIDQEKLHTFKCNGMNFTGWYHGDGEFEDVLSGAFPMSDVYILDESPDTTKEVLEQIITDIQQTEVDKCFERLAEVRDRLKDIVQGL
jgi:hypothetical protein